MAYEKIPVKVTAEFSKNGGIKPIVLEWNDGQKFIIDRVVLRENKPCRSGEILVERFTVKINGQERYLYYEKIKELWFVERKI